MYIYIQYIYTHICIYRYTGPCTHHCTCSDLCCNSNINRFVRWHVHGPVYLQSHSGGEYARPYAGRRACSDLYESSHIDRYMLVGMYMALYTRRAIQAVHITMKVPTMPRGPEEVRWSRRAGMRWIPTASCVFFSKMVLHGCRKWLP